MRAMVYTAPQTLEMREVAMPECASPDDAIVQIEACGIGGSDLHAWHGHDERRPSPIVLGHEAVGTIVEGHDAGQRVAINPLVTCGTCRHCLLGRENLCAERQIISMPPRPGAFADYVTIPMRNLVPVPNHVEPTSAALIEPLACGWHGVRLATEVSKVDLNDAIVVVIGGGAVGIGAALTLDIFGAKNICVLETNPKRHRAIQCAGPFNVLTPEAYASNEGHMPDLVIDAAGFASTRALASSIAGSGSVIVHVGLSDASSGLDVRRITLQEITFIGSNTYSDEDFRDTAAALFEGHYGLLDWIDVRPLSDGPDAFRELGTSETAAPKIVLQL